MESIIEAIKKASSEIRSSKSLAPSCGIVSAEIADEMDKIAEKQAKNDKFGRYYKCRG